MVILPPVSPHTAVPKGIESYPDLISVVYCTASGPVQPWPRIVSPLPPSSHFISEYDGRGNGVCMMKASATPHTQVCVVVDLFNIHTRVSYSGGMSWYLFDTENYLWWQQPPEATLEDLNFTTFRGGHTCTAIPPYKQCALHSVLHVCISSNVLCTYMYKQCFAHSNATAMHIAMLCTYKQCTLYTVLHARISIVPPSPPHPRSKESCMKPCTRTCTSWEPALTSYQSL